MSKTGGIPILAIALLLAVLVFTLAAYVVPDGADPLIIYPCLVTFYAIAFHALRRPTFVHPLIPTHLTIEALFLAFCFLLFFMPYQMAALGLFDLSSSRFVARTFIDQSNQAIVLSTAGMAAFYLGAIWKRAPGVDRPASSLPPSRNAKLRYLPQLTALGLGGLIILYHMAGWRSAGEGRYTGTTSGGVLAEGVSTLILMFSMIATALVVVKLSRRQKLGLATVIAAGLAAYWSLYLLSFGDRNSFLLIAIVGFGGIFTFHRRVRLQSLILLVLIAIPVYSAMELVRMAANATLSDLVSQDVRDYVTDESSFNISTITVRAALAVVPDHYDFGYGMFKLIGIAGVVPFVRGWVMGPSQIFATTADVNTASMLPPGSNWGVGTNIISDLYIDFGVIGVAIGMFLVGRFAGWVRNRVALAPEDTSRIIIYLLAMALLAELPRYSFDFPVRILAWTAILIAAARIVTSAPSALVVRKDDQPRLPAARS